MPFVVYGLGRIELKAGKWDVASMNVNGGTFSLDDARLFARVVESGGFSAAARLTGQPKSTLSKRVAMLESTLGVRLLNRNSRRLSLTAAGEDFHAHVSAMLIEAEAAEAAIQARLSGPRGRLRMTASLITARYHLAPILPAIAEKYPEVQLILHATDRMVDIVQEAFDLALRDHHAPLPSSDLSQRRVGFEPDYLVASPAYLEARGEPEGPQALEVHDGLMNGAIAGPFSWRLTREDGEESVVSPRLRAFADDPDTLLELALAGLGIAAMPRSQCAHHLARGSLVRVAPGWIAGGATTTLLVPHRRGQLPAVRAVADELVLMLRERLREA